MNARTLLKSINSLEAEPPATKSFGKELSKRGLRNSTKVWYETQKQHWQGWLKDYNGGGAYNCKDWYEAARFIYNHINCPQSLLWLTEASGIKKSLVIKTKNYALATDGHFVT